MEGALEMLRRRLAERHETAAAAAAAAAAGAPAPGPIDEALQAHHQAAAAAAAAAVLAVEQQLVYQQFEFVVAGIQLLTLNTELGGGPGGSGRSRGGSGGDHGDGAGPSASRRQVLQPVQLAGALKLHRITDVRRVLGSWQ